METVITKKWVDYELIDSGNKKRLERFGAFFVVRPEPSALWQPQQPSHQGWKQPDASFTGDKPYPWNFAAGFPNDGWSLSWEGISFLVKPTAFRHMGIFPEQAVHWQWLKENVESMKKTLGRQPKVLNLFGYTGIASLVAAKAGADVCHVDASKSTVQWASENARQNGLSVRWIVDDALKFMQRETRRQATYDIILMDPPVFGRGPKGEIWRLETFLAELAQVTKELLTRNESKLLVNFYATDLYPEAVARTFHHALGSTCSLNLIELCLEEDSGNLLQTGYSLRSR